jgi:hypothetical protein
MASLFKLKRTDVQGRVPTTGQLELGELAVNTYDGTIFLKKDISGIETVVTVATLDGQQTLSNKTLASPAITGSATLTSTLTTSSALTLTANFLQDGYGILNLSGSEPDILINQTYEGNNSITFSAIGTKYVSLGRKDNNDFYVSWRNPLVDSGAWHDDALTISNTTGQVSIEKGITLGAEGITFSDNTTQTTAALPLTVSLRDGNGINGTAITEVTALRFDEDSGFDVVDLGAGEVKIAMNSTFKTWKVDGQNDLVAQGLDTVEFIAGSGIVLTTDPNGSPNKTLTIATIDKTVKLYQDGNLEPTTGTVRWHTPASINVKKIIARVAEAPDVNLTVNVLKNGTQAETLTVSAATDKTTEIVDFNMSGDDYLTVDIVFSGGFGGNGLSVEFTYSFT